MKKFISVCICLTALLCTAALATDYRKETVGVSDVDIRRRGEAVDVDMTIIYDKLVLRNNEQLTVTPLIVSGADTVALPPVLFRGEVFDIVAQRKAGFYEEFDTYTAPYDKVVFSRAERRDREHALHGKRTPVQTGEDIIRYAGTFMYPVSSGATVILHQEIEGCGDSDLADMRTVGNIAQPVAPRISFLVPVVTETAPRKAMLTAHINFEQDKYVVKPEIADNRTELQKIYDFTSEMMSDEDIEVRRIIVRSYASPEATYEYNARLSQHRAEAVRDNVIDRMDLNGTIFDTQSVPEDWDSLRTWIADSNLPSKEELLRIIDTTSDPDAREAKIKEYDRSTYNILYADVYPNLRRTDIEIEYDLKPVTLERGLLLIETDPSKMRLDNMMEVAEYYGRDSKDYERALHTTLRYYPYEVAPNNNMAALALMDGNTHSARRYLERFEDHPECLNNLGIAAHRDGDTRQAEQYFRRAADMGCEEARYNLEHIAYLGY
ncbi:MAG: DUF3868 domain-containing protein [Alistipes sp.]|nr:DUF3868 domain-containing protein [Alistipes sp.]